MRPAVELLSSDLVERIIAEGMALLADPGIRVHNEEALRLLAEAGADSAQSLEKVVIDADIIGMGRRLVAGIEAREEPIALTLMREMGHNAEYLADPHTHRWFRRELFFPSEVIDRSTLEEWEQAGAKSAFERASERVERLVGSYQPAPLPDAARRELERITLRAARPFGMEALPALVAG